ncbi:secreted protein containing DUF1592 [Rhodopirellula maiorica SM1]|uniref:Secreted protein containing DUF1592 n=1 Tax=Rhodopirellula maiorica SM1 TaxID=1265738 RepID=M5RK14_9BACT|nr:DUF1592 domain-containing protein [Rhodopirellula maiorica]EMI15717.1 secreted protein containing DUF1592 [Rhodopirellula maiorica SM1]
MKSQFSIFVVLLGSLLVGIQLPRISNAQVSESTNTPTLEEVKDAGALKSIYRQQAQQPKTFVKPQANLKEFREEIEPALKKACYECHGAETAEGDIRVDTLNPDLLHGDDVSWWLEVSSAVGNGEMPPEDGPELSDKDRKKIVEWLSAEIQTASRVRRAERAHSSFRRMTRYEYNYALQDLLGLELDFVQDLPPDPISEDGFENCSETLQITGDQYAEYLELNRNALHRATISGDRPAVLHWGVSAEAAAALKFAELEKSKEQAKKPRATQKGRARQRGGRGGYYMNITTGETAPATWSYGGAREAWTPKMTLPDVPEQSKFLAVLPARQRIVVELGNRLPDEGTMRVRVRASRASSESQAAPTLALEFGWQGDKDQRAAFRISRGDMVIDASAEEPKFYQWDIPLSVIHPRNPVRKLEELGVTDRTNPSEYIRLYNTAKDQSAAIHFDYVQVSAPVYDQWPPQSHRAIFIESDNRNDEQAYAREIISRFMRRAWRRDVSNAEVDLQMDLFTRVRPICSNFEQAVVETLAAVLSSPRFLYLVHTDQPQSQTHQAVDEFELATRLSMFLWCSVPDEELLELAAEGQLSHPDQLARQTQRMLADPRHERFSKHFVRQWLNMAPLEFVNINKKAYPQFDDELMDAMQQEPIALFEEILQNNLSVMDFLHADYAVVNRRLATHYGLDDVQGNNFKRVSLNPEDHRGGLLTQAALLAMNSDGTESHPLKRGIWLLESILNDPPPPPPPAVPEIDMTDPEIMKMTLKQRMEDHRNKAACMSCHVKIDPWGIAFENFDAVGKWRTQSQGKDIDASSLLYNEQQLDGVDGVKRFLLANRQDQFARAIVEKMATFAFGRTLAFGDRAEIERITTKLRHNGDGLQTLILELVRSDLFTSI